MWFCSKWLVNQSPLTSPQDIAYSLFEGRPRGRTWKICLKFWGSDFWSTIHIYRREGLTYHPYKGSWYITNLANMSAFFFKSNHRNTRTSKTHGEKIVTPKETLGGNSNMFYFHPYFGKWSNLTSIFFRWVGSTTNYRTAILWRYIFSPHM